MLIQSFFDTKKRKITGLVLVVLSLFLFISAKYQSSNSNVVSTENSAYNTVIFDLGEVLFSTNSNGKHALIIGTILKNPTLLYHLINFDTKKEYFDFLRTVPAATTCTIFHNNQPMPAIMVDWQTGISSGKEITDKVTAQLEKSQHPTAIKNLFYAIATFMFTPHKLANCQQPIAEMVKLAKDLKAAGYKLFVLSNWDALSFEIVQKNNPEVFNLFDGILISGQEKIAKPNPEFFKKLLQRYDINPSTTIFIDDEPSNIATANTLGITSILCDTHESAIQKLIDTGILQITS